MKQKITFSILSCCLPFLFSHPTDARTSLNEEYNLGYSVKKWNNESGLPQNTVFDIIQDTKGFLWVSTEEGILRFDGNEFTPLSISALSTFTSSNFYDLAPSKSGGFWTSNGYEVVYILEDDHEIFQLESAETRIITMLEDQNGKLWVGTNNGKIFYLRNKKFQELSIDLDISNQSSIEAMHEIDDSFIIGTSSGLYKIKKNGNGVEFFVETKTAYITSIAEDIDGIIWIGSQNNGLYQLSGEKVTRHFTKKDGLKELYIRSLGASPDGRVFLGTNSSGVQVVQNRTISDFKVSNFANQDIRCIYTNDPNLTWFGSVASGLILILKNEIQQFRKHELPKIILPIHESSPDDIWIGTAGHGLRRIYKDTVIAFTQKTGLSNDLVLSVYSTEKAIYVGTANGLNKILPNNNSIERIYNPNMLGGNIVSLVFQSSDKTLWIGTKSEGIYILDEEEHIFSKVKLPTTLNDAVFLSAFEDSRNTIWFGTKQSGILSIGPDGSARHYNHENGLPQTDDIMCFFEDDDKNLWIGTGSGLILYSDGKFQTFTKQNGLSFNAIFNIIRDNEDYLWLSGNYGLQRFHLDDLKFLKANKKNAPVISGRRFTTADGLPNQELNGGIFPAGWKMSNGNIWFPTINGIAIIDNDFIESNREQPNVFINHIKFADQVISVSNEITIRAGTSNIEIDYSSINFSHAHAVEYYYRIKEINDEWVNTGNKTNVFFTLLEPGDYTFQVKANLFGQFSKVSEVDFTIKPFFHQTWWFKLLLILLLIVSIFFLIDYYYTRKKEVHLSSLVDKKTEELKNINAHLESALKNVEKQNLQLKEIAWTQSHIVRAPVAKILGFLSIMEGNKVPSDKRKKAMVYLRKAGEDLDIIIKDIVKKSEDVIRNDSK